VPVSSPTQSFVPIKEIKDGVIILPSGELRAILIASSVNLSLKSQDEQQAILLQFQNYLNSLDFETQTVVQSRRLDIRPYINLLENRAKNVLGDLLKTQIKEYIEFIKTFTDSTNIMTKSFFVVIPYLAPLTKSGSPFDLLKNKSGAMHSVEDIAFFEENRSQLEQRISTVEQGLGRVGVRTARLGTEEIIELFYKLFNPGDTEKPIMPTKTQ
jgi:hypothetical protein